MRLTLRTLLAYMDGLLDPKDSQEIGKKIEDSKFATELFHKIRDVMRRLRLAAPSISERGANLDCNTVAEYLDNVMPGDRVPDFEEVSLKSDMHLAEVASCHQILTMVLGEPAEIDLESRQRMYQLPTVANRVDEERQAAVEAANVLSGDGNGPPPSASPPVKVRPRPVVPEYLRDPPRKSRLLLAAAVMLLVGAAVGLLAVVIYPNAGRWLQAKISGGAPGAPSTLGPPGRADDERRDAGDSKRAPSHRAVRRPVGRKERRKPKAAASWLPRTVDARPRFRGGRCPGPTARQSAGYESKQRLRDNGQSDSCRGHFVARGHDPGGAGNRARWRGGRPKSTGPDLKPRPGGATAGR